LPSISLRLVWFVLSCIALTEQVWNTDESMIKAEEWMKEAVAAVVSDNLTSRAEFVIPSLPIGYEAASMVTTVCADRTQIPNFVVVSWSGGRLPYAENENEDGSNNLKPLVRYLDGGAVVHPRGKPRLDEALWEVRAGLTARLMGTRCAGEWKVLLLNGCKERASPVDVSVLRRPGCRC